MALDFHRDLIALRKAEIVPRLKGTPGRSGTAEVLEGGVLTASWTLGDDSRLTLVANMSAEATAKPPAMPDGRLLYATAGPDSEHLEQDLPPWTVAWFIAEGSAA